MFEPFVPLVLPAEVDATSIAKANVRGILDSYHGDWDFLIETLQNAIDAIDLKYNGPSITDKKNPFRLHLPYWLTVYFWIGGLTLSSDLAARYPVRGMP